MTDEQPENSPKPLSPSDKGHDQREDQSTRQVQDSEAILDDVETGSVCESTVKQEDSNLEGERGTLDISKPDGDTVQQPGAGDNIALAESVSDEKPTEIINEDGHNQSDAEGQHALQVDSGDDTPPESKETSEEPAVECGPKDDEKPVDSTDGEKHLKDKEEAQEESKEMEFQKSSQNQAEEQMQEVEAREPVQGDGGGEQTELQQQDRSDMEETKAAEQGQLEASQEKDDKLAHSQEEANIPAEPEQQETSERQESQTATEHFEEIKETSKAVNGSVPGKDLEVEHTVETPSYKQVEKPEEDQVEIIRSIENQVEKPAPSEVTAVEQGLIQYGTLAGGRPDDHVQLNPPSEMQEENKKLKQEIFVAKQQADAFRIRALSLEQEVGKLRARKIDNRSQDSLASDSDSYLKQKLAETERELDAAERKVKDLQLRLKRFAKDDQIKDEKISQMERELKELSDSNKKLEQSLVESKIENNNANNTMQAGLGKSESKVCVIL